MTTWTYQKRAAAHLEGNDVSFPANTVTVPDQVADDQHAYAGRQHEFPALTSEGQEITVWLDGDAYGLNTTGTGDMVVRVV